MYEIGTLGNFKYVDNNMIKNNTGYIEPQVDYTMKTLSNQSYVQNQQTMQNFTEQYLKPLNYGISTLGTLGSLYLGFKNYGLAKDQLSLAKDQWSKTKEELDRIKSLREKITSEWKGE